METEYLQVIMCLGAVILLFLVCIYFLKKAKGMNTKDNQHLKILKAVSMGSKEKLVVVEFNKSKLLLGVTPNHIESLYICEESVDEKPSFANIKEECRVD